MMISLMLLTHYYSAHYKVVMDFKENWKYLICQARLARVQVRCFFFLSQVQVLKILDLGISICTWTQPWCLEDQQVGSHESNLLHATLPGQYYFVHGSFDCHGTAPRSCTHPTFPVRVTKRICQAYSHISSFVCACMRIELCVNHYMSV